MANVMRWRYGETNPVTLPVGTADAIEIGDLVHLESSAARPASTIDDIGGAGPATLAAAQEVFHDGFVGVAMQRSPVGNTDSIRIATSGVFEFDVASATFDLGDRLGVDDVAAGDKLENQKVIAVTAANPERSIGRVARAVATADTKVLLEINSTIMRDGPQAVA